MVFSILLIILKLQIIIIIFCWKRTAFKNNLKQNGLNLLNFRRNYSNTYRY